MFALVGSDASRLVADVEYRPFPLQSHRNIAQERFEVPALVRLLHIPARRRILEVGCGPGVAIPLLWRLCRPTRLAGADIDRRLLAEAATRIHEEGVAAELFHADVRALPFADASFDVVLDFGTCYHIARPEEALREVARVLGPGGMFVTETRLSQLVSHPIRSIGRRIPWEEEPSLRPLRSRGLWAARIKSESRRPAAKGRP